MNLRRQERGMIEIANRTTFSSLTPTFPFSSSLYISRNIGLLSKNSDVLEFQVRIRDMNEPFFKSIKRAKHPGKQTPTSKLPIPSTYEESYITTPQQKHITFHIITNEQLQPSKLKEISTLAVIETVHTYLLC